MLAAFASTASGQLLRATDPLIRFSGSGATISAHCPQSQDAALLYVTPKEFVDMQRYPAGEVVTAILMGVTTQCSSSGLDVPCTSAVSPGRPAGFLCNWTSTHGSETTGPFAAWPRPNTYGGHAFGYEAAVNCTLPSTTTYLSAPCASFRPGSTHIRWSLCLAQRTRTALQVSRLGAGTRPRCR